MTRAIQSHSHNGLCRYNRQFWEAAEAYFLKNLETRKERHRQLALFFNGHWAGTEKPYLDELKDKVQKTFSGETSGDRRVRPQPFALRNGVVWEQGAELNVRRGVEAIHHMLRGGLLKEAAEELCSLDGVCSCALMGEAFNLIQHYAMWRNDALSHAANPPHGDGAYRKYTSVKHFSKWVRRDAHILKSQSEIICSLLRQPDVSSPRIMLLDSLKQISLPFSPKRMLGGNKSDLDAPVAVLKGPEGKVLSVAWSPKGDQLASASADQTAVVWNVASGEQVAQLTGHTG